MRILVITKFRHNSADIVFSRVINCLTDHHSVDLVYSGRIINQLDVSKLSRLFCINTITTYDNISTRLYFYFLKYLGVDPLFYISFSRIKKILKNEYDLIFSFIGLGCLLPLYVGYKLSKCWNCKSAAYSVDPIPPRIGWISQFGSDALKKFMRCYSRRIDAFFSLNIKMLDHQINIIDRKEIVADVILSPTLPVMSNYKNSDNLTFLYTGKFYALRKTKYLFFAFKQLLMIYPNAELILVGCKIPESDFDCFSSVERIKIKVVEHFIDNLDEYYEKSSFLLDIDGDLEEDEFMSGKIANYISINRIIICETGKNSPSRYYFKDIPSIIQCNHDSESLYQGMLKAIRMKNNIDFSDREKVIRLFSKDNISHVINKSMNKLFEK